MHAAIFNKYSCQYLQSWSFTEYVFVTNKPGTPAPQCMNRQQSTTRLRPRGNNRSNPYEQGCLMSQWTNNRSNQSEQGCNNANHHGNNHSMNIWQQCHTRLQEICFTRIFTGFGINTFWNFPADLTTFFIHLHDFGDNLGINIFFLIKKLWCNNFFTGIYYK